MKKLHTNKGFTLAELLIVVAVIAVLVAVAIPTFGNQLEKSRQAVDVANLRGAYAAGRLAEMDGGVNGFKFDGNKANIAVGTATADTSKFYAAYWYDPDTGKLALIDAASTTSEGTTTYSLTSETAIEHFLQTSQKGKAQGLNVVADTSQLPGEGKSLVIYTDAQLANIDEVSQGGTVDRAIRVVFFKTNAGTYKLHEIAFVAKSDEALVKEGTEDTITPAPQTEGTSNEFASGTYYFGTGGNKAFTIDFSKDYTINGAAFNDELYFIKATAGDGITDLEVSGSKISGKIAKTKTTTNISILVISKADATITGKTTIAVASDTKPQ